MSSQIAIADDPPSGRYVIGVDGEPVGFLTYRLEPGQIALLHAEMDPAREGGGLGSQLTAFALDDARARGLSVLPFCPFVSAYIRRHDEYSELVPASVRGRFLL